MGMDPVMIQKLLNTTNRHQCMILVIDHPSAAALTSSMVNAATLATISVNGMTRPTG